MRPNISVDALLQEEGERILPLLQYTLKKAYPEFSFPRDLEERARQWRLNIVARNLLYIGELKKILKSFNEKRIPSIPLKGVVMEGIYPAGLRPFGDVDILIHREDLSRALEILEGMGYRPHGPLWRPGTEVFQGELAYVKDGDFPIMIEPHWSLGPPYPYPERLDMAAIWKRARKAKVADVDTLILCPEDMYLHACLHLVQHNRGGWLVTACDIAELTYHFQGVFDWDRFLKWVEEFKLVLPVRYSLERVDNLFHPPFPKGVLERLREARPNKFERWLFASLTSPGDRDNRDAATFLARIVTVPGLRLKLRYFWDMLFPAREFMEGRYPELMGRPIIFYYLYRFKDIVRKGIKLLRRLFSRRA